MISRKNKFFKLLYCSSKNAEIFLEYYNKFINQTNVMSFINSMWNKNSNILQIKNLNISKENIYDILKFYYKDEDLEPGDIKNNKEVAAILLNMNKEFFKFLNSLNGVAEINKLHGDLSVLYCLMNLCRYKLLENSNKSIDEKTKNVPENMKITLFLKELYNKSEESYIDFFLNPDIGTDIFVNPDVDLEDLFSVQPSVNLEQLKSIIEPFYFIILNKNIISLTNAKKDVVIDSLRDINDLNIMYIEDVNQQKRLYNYVKTKNIINEFLSEIVAQDIFDEYTSDELNELIGELYGWDKIIEICNLNNVFRNKEKFIKAIEQIDLKSTNDSSKNIITKLFIEKILSSDTSIHDRFDFIRILVKLLPIFGNYLKQSLNSEDKNMFSLFVQRERMDHHFAPYL